MKKHFAHGTVFLLLSAVFAQTLLSAPLPAYAQAVITAYAPEQLEQLVAPIALYPDSLLGEVLMASTYPLEVAEAAQWRNANPGISGDYLTAALMQKPWDPSVKGLTEFPQVLQMMNSNLDWTEKLGEAFLGDQPDLMDAVQQLRRQAQATGALVSNQQEAVVQQDGYIAIQPADPALVYVPYYNPAVVFSPWPYPAYLPYSFAAPNGVVYANGFFAYSTGIVVVDALWGWDTWDWHDHRLHVDDRHWRNLDNGQPPAQHNEWGFQPEHRHNVPYKDVDVRTHFENAPPQTLRPYRGFEEDTTNGFAQRSREVQERPPITPVDTTHRIITPGEPGQPEMRQPEMRQPEARAPEMPRPVAPPMFESFAPRQQVQAEQARGSLSAHAPQPEARSPEPARNDSHDESQKDDKK